MPKSFSKVHKKISKKRGQVEALHENSRDAKRLHRANHREERVARASATTSRGRQSYRMLLIHAHYYLWKHSTDLLAVDRVIMIQESIPEGSGPFSDDDIRELVTRYVYISIYSGLFSVSSRWTLADQCHLADISTAASRRLSNYNTSDAKVDRHQRRKKFCYNGRKPKIKN